MNLKNKKKLNECNKWIEFDSTQEIQRILNGIGNINIFLATFEREFFGGMTLRLFNPKNMSLYWADS